MNNKDSLMQRLGQFKEMAAEARKDAARASTPELKRTYEELARAWEELIAEIETFYRGEKLARQ